MTSKSTNRVTGQEQVSMAAGRFTAWKIQVQTVSSEDEGNGATLTPIEMPK